MLSCDYAINAPAGDYVVATFDDLFSIEGIILLFLYLSSLIFPYLSFSYWKQLSWTNIEVYFFWNF